jgi:hypothetical protein
MILCVMARTACHLPSKNARSGLGRSISEQRPLPRVHPRNPLDQLRNPIDLAIQVVLDSRWAMLMELRMAAKFISRWAKSYSCPRER